MRKGQPHSSKTKELISLNHDRWSTSGDHRPYFHPIPVARYAPGRYGVANLATWGALAMSNALGEFIHLIKKPKQKVTTKSVSGGVYLVPRGAEEDLTNNEEL